MTEGSSRELPSIAREAFAELVAGVPGAESSPDDLPDRLLLHYEELRRWNPRVSLVGPGTASDVLSRHYGESLGALEWVPATGTLVDVGSGAGFPGVVLAAARPGLSVTLMEPRLRKWSFLESSRRATGLSYRCLDARVARPLPPGLPAAIDVITSRAVRMTREMLGSLLEHSPRVRMILWQGETNPVLPPGLQAVREKLLPGSRHRRLIEVASR